jgi:hypothetical protein
MWALLRETAVGRGAMSSYGPTKILFLFNPLPHECTQYVMRH